MGFHRSVCAAIAFTIALAGVQGSALAEEDARAQKKRLAAELKAHATTLKDVAKKKSAGAMKSALRKIVEWHRALPPESTLRQKSIKMIGRQASPGTKRKDVQKVVLDALGATEDGRAGYQIRRWLRPWDEPHVDSVLKRAIEVAAKVPHECTAAPLLKIVEKSKNGTVAGGAVVALGHFRRIKSARGKIFVDLCSTVKKDKPGTGAPNRSGNAPSSTPGGPETSSPSGPAFWGGSSRRWDALSLILPKALSQLTGRDLFGVDECFELARTHKTKLDALFLPEEEPDDETDDD